jgi:hypothetical protein
MADTENPAATLLDELAALDPYQRHEVAKHLRRWPRTSPRSPMAGGFSPA